MTAIHKSIAVSVESLVRVLVVGGSYGGLATALNLLDLSQGKAARFSAGQTASDPVTLKAPTSTPVQVTIVDERDGYCKKI